jgi:Protein of unknown function (DUF4233)
MQRLCATVLVMEAIVIGLAIPVAIAVGHANPWLAGGAGGAVAIAAVVLAGLAGRRGRQPAGPTETSAKRWPFVAGSVLQLVLIASGFLVTVMFFLGVVFAALWAIAIWLGYRVEHGLAR